MVSDDLYVCKVCGLRQEEPPWGDAGDSPTYDICDCCGTEFVYEDATPVGVVRARAGWAAAGYRWTVPTARPEHADPLTQLAAAGLPYPPPFTSGST